MDNNFTNPNNTEISQPQMNYSEQNIQYGQSQQVEQSNMQYGQSQQVEQSNMQYGQSQQMQQPDTQMQQPNMQMQQPNMQMQQPNMQMQQPNMQYGQLQQMQARPYQQQGMYANNPYYNQTPNTFSNKSLNMHPGARSNSVALIEGVFKYYVKGRYALNNINLCFEPGRIIGLLGPNGSGKTTLIKLLAGLLQPNGGNMRICGYPIGPESKSFVSYLPDKTYFNEDIKIKRHIEMFKDFYADFDEQRAYYMLSTLGIDPNLTMKKLSKGNSEKVQLIMAMSRRAKLYLLDEPIAGVDPAARDYILNTILTNYDPSATILISTHLIQDVEGILDEVIFIKNGNIVCHENAEQLRLTNGKTVDILFREVFRC